jgi:predicted enzyme related to lactoylglutathione lyase
MTDMSGNGNIIGVLARVYVDDLDAALPLYERLTGETPYQFDYGPMSLAKVGDFLLVANATAQVRTHTATIDVRDMALVVDALTAAGGELLEGPAAGPNGARLIARHPDGTVVEYIESTLH